MRTVLCIPKEHRFTQLPLLGKEGGHSLRHLCPGVLATFYSSCVADGATVAVAYRRHRMSACLMLSHSSAPCMASGLCGHRRIDGSDPDLASFEHLIYPVFCSQICAEYDPPADFFFANLRVRSRYAAFTIKKTRAERITTCGIGTVRMRISARTDYQGLDIRRTITRPNRGNNLSRLQGRVA